MQPKRVAVPYDTLIELAMRRGETIGFGDPACALGDPDDLVSSASLSSRASSPERQEGYEHRADADIDPVDADGRWRTKRLEQARCAVRQHVRQAQADLSDDGAEQPSSLKRKRGGGLKSGPPGKKACHNAGQTNRPGIKRSSQAGSKRRKKAKADKARALSSNKPYARVRDPKYFRLHHSVFIISLETLNIVYEATSGGYTSKQPNIKIRGRIWNDSDLRRAKYKHWEWDGE